MLCVINGFENCVKKKRERRERFVENSPFAPALLIPKLFMRIRNKMMILYIVGCTI